MKLLEKKELGNGMMLFLEDASSQIAGDRHNVKVVCRLTIPVIQEWYNGLSDSTEMIEQIKILIGDELEFQTTKERNFIDQAEKEDVVSELVKQVNNHIISYLSSDLFPEKLFSRKYEDVKSAVLREEEINLSEFDEDDEPADFSACFIDK